MNLKVLTKLELTKRRNANWVCEREEKESFRVYKVESECGAVSYFLKAKSGGREDRRSFVFISHFALLFSLFFFLDHKYI